MQIVPFYKEDKSRMLVGVSGFFVMREKGITVELVDYIGILFCVIYIYIYILILPHFILAKLILFCFLLLFFSNAFLCLC